MIWISCNLGAKARDLPDPEKLNPFNSRKEETGKPDFREKLRNLKSFAHTLPRSAASGRGAKQEKLKGAK
ncbi:MAG: hypothetical protein WCV67_03115 [Victivallaceae bacterium]